MVGRTPNPPHMSSFSEKLKYVAHPCSPRTLRSAVARMKYTPHSPYFWDCLSEHGANVALLWSWAAFACRVQRLSAHQLTQLHRDKSKLQAIAAAKWPHYGYCQISDRKLGELLGIPRVTAQDLLPRAFETGWVHGWRMPRRSTVLALGVLPRTIKRKDKEPQYAASIAVPHSAYGFEFGTGRGGGTGNIVRLCPMSGSWWVVDPLGRQGPVNGVGRVLDFKGVMRYG